VGAKEKNTKSPKKPHVGENHGRSRCDQFTKNNRVTIRSFHKRSGEGGRQGKGFCVLQGRRTEWSGKQKVRATQPKKK